MRRVRSTERTELLRSIWLFERCTSKELQAIARLTTPMLVEAGRVLASEGSTGGEFFVIVEGRADATIRGTRVGELGPGDFFGEMALLDHGPRVATVVATEPMLLLVLSGREFDALVEKAIPSVSRRMLMVLGERLRVADKRLVGDEERLAGL